MSSGGNELKASSSMQHMANYNGASTTMSLSLVPATAVPTALMVKTPPPPHLLPRPELVSKREGQSPGRFLSLVLQRAFPACGGGMAAAGSAGRPYRLLGPPARVPEGSLLLLVGVATATMPAPCVGCSNLGAYMAAGNQRASCGVVWHT